MTNGDAITSMASPTFAIKSRNLRIGCRAMTIGGRENSAVVVSHIARSKTFTTGVAVAVNESSKTEFCSIHETPLFGFRFWSAAIHHRFHCLCSANVENLAASKRMWADTGVVSFVDSSDHSPLTIPSEECGQRNESQMDLNHFGCGLPGQVWISNCAG